MQRHPKETPATPRGPFPSEKAWNDSATDRKNQQRQSSGNLPDEPKDQKVDNGKRPFKNLRSE